MLQDASVATPKHVSSPSRQSPRRVAESPECRESSACVHARPIDGLDRFHRPTPQWAAKCNLLWRRRTVVLLERTFITILHCLPFVLEKAPRQAWLWPILYRNIGHMVVCELIGDNGGNGKTDARTDAKVQVVKTAVSSFFFVLVDFERVRMLPFLESTTRFSVLSCDYHGVARAACKKPIKKTHVKIVRPLSCPSSVMVFSIFFQRCCVVEGLSPKHKRLEWSRDWSCAAGPWACARWT